jgi:hypothetical protein
LFGNPGGRPKAAHDLRVLARTHPKEALETMVELMRHGESDSVRLSAAEKILDRAWGKPMQNVSQTRRSSPKQPSLLSIAHAAVLALFDEVIAAA